jgi:hypothetical protein
MALRGDLIRVDLIVLDSYFDGTSAADSLPSLMAKSLANIGAVWGAGHALNLAVDTVKVARSKPGTRGSRAGVGIAAGQCGGPQRVCGDKTYVAPKPTVNSSLAGNIKACPALLQQRSGFVHRKAKMDRQYKRVFPGSR